jgi:hypothetical protein
MHCKQSSTINPLSLPSLYYYYYCLTSDHLVKGKVSHCERNSTKPIKLTLVSIQSNVRPIVIIIVYFHSPHLHSNNI